MAILFCADAVRTVICYESDELRGREPPRRIRWFDDEFCCGSAPAGPIGLFLARVAKLWRHS